MIVSTTTSARLFVQRTTRGMSRRRRGGPPPPTAPWPPKHPDKMGKSDRRLGGKDGLGHGALCLGACGAAKDSLFIQVIAWNVLASGDTSCSNSAPKLALLEEYALVARALSAPARLMLLEQLAQGERGVEALADRDGPDRRQLLANILQQHAPCRPVTSRRDGKAVIYRLTDAEDAHADGPAARRRRTEPGAGRAYPERAFRR